MVSTHPTGNALGGRPARQNWGKFDAHNRGGFNARSHALFGVVFCNSFGAFVLSRDVGSSADAKEPTSRAVATNIACCLMNHLCRPSPRETSANSSS